MSDSASQFDAELQAKATQAAAEAEASETDDIPSDRNTPPTNSDPTDQRDVQTDAVDIDGFPSPVAPLSVDLEAERLQEEEFNKEEEAPNDVPSLLVGPPQTPEPVSIPATSLLPAVPGAVTAVSPQNPLGAPEESPATPRVPPVQSSPARRGTFARLPRTRTITVNVRHYFPQGVPIMVIRRRRRPSFLMRRF